MNTITNSTSLTISNITIHTDVNGKFCLNDLHKAAGGENRHRPKYWLALDQTKELIKELSESGIPPTLINQPVTIIQGGTGIQGTFVSKELVYAYATWISPKFFLHVIQAFDENVQTKQFGFENIINQSRIEAARQLHRTSGELVAALEREEQMKLDNVFFKKSLIEDASDDCISLKNIKIKYAPWLAIARIEQWLNYIGHPRGSFRHQSANDSIISIPFLRDGLEEAFERLIDELDFSTNHSKTRAIIRHECFIKASVRVSKEDAIEYLDYDEEEFE
jgi:hypothetical protein